MVCSCCAINCRNRFGKLDKNGGKLRFHHFPLKNPALLKLWVDAAMKKGKTPNKDSVVCSDHFADDCYVTPFRRYLNKDAVPTIFKAPGSLKKKGKEMPNVAISSSSAVSHVRTDVPPNGEESDKFILIPVINPSLLTTEVYTSHPHLVKNEVSPYVEESETIIPDPLINPSSSTFEVSKETEIPSGHLPIIKKEVPDMEENEAVIPDPLINPSSSTFEASEIRNISASPPSNIVKDGKQARKDKIKELQKKVKSLQEKLRRRDKQVSDLKSMLISGSLGDAPLKSEMFMNSLGDIPFNILASELKNEKQKPNGRRYSDKMKEFALTLYFCSPKAYKLLRNKIFLPHPALIRKWISSEKYSPDFNALNVTVIDEEI